MTKITGFQRMQLVKLWIKQGRDGDKEDFIKAVCKAKNLEYVPPVPRNITRDASMFPAKVTS